jgi:nucleotide-binding universal stress UspA family protein
MLIEGDDHADAVLLKLMECCTVPVLVLRHMPDELRRVLICTAAGEPGKCDIREGGKLARRLKASVILLHVRPTGSRDISLTAKAHLERAAATLRGLDLAGSVKIREAASPAEGILTEAREGAHDLIVAGVPSTGSRSHSEDITFRVLNGTQLAVLVVPMGEE